MAGSATNAAAKTVTQRSLKRRLHRLSARRAASYHRTTLVHLLTAMFSISRSILEVLVRAWQVLKHLWAFDCQNGTFMINVPQVAGCNHSQAS